MSSITLLPVIDAAACCAPLTRDAMTQSQADDLAKSLKAIADPARLRLLSIIAASEDQEACVCDLTEPLDIGQPTVSHHLAILREAGLVHVRQEGKQTFYSLNQDHVVSCCGQLMIKFAPQQEATTVLEKGLS